MTPSELEAMRRHYARRAERGLDGAYRFALPAQYLSLQERERALLGWLRVSGPPPPARKRLLEVGCGTGRNLLDFLRYGFDPAHLVGNDVLEERLAVARRRLPSEVRLIAGDAAELELPEGSFDVVFQSTVFTSLLDAEQQARVARRMWRLARPGGGVLWYDFLYDNPRNPEVAGVPLRRIRALFPGGGLTYWRVTLAPPLARLVTRLHPSLYSLFNLLPILRTHVLCWIRKPGVS